jgi:hypothetical protein
VSIAPARWTIDPDDPRAPQRRTLRAPRHPDRLRFSVGEAPVPYADELLERVSRLSDEALERVELREAELAEAQRRSEEEQRRREEEQRRREAAEAELETLRAEVERLRGK